MFTRNLHFFSGYMHWNSVVAKLQLILDLNFACFSSSNLFVYGNFYENSSVGMLPETFGWSYVNNFDYTNPYFEIIWFQVLSFSLWLVWFSCFILYYYWSKPLLLLFNSESFKIMLKKRMCGYALHIFTEEYIGISGVQSFCLCINSGDLKCLFIQKSVITWHAFDSVWKKSASNWYHSEIWPTQRNSDTFMGS